MQRYDKHGGIRWRLARLCLLCIVLYACHKSPFKPIPPDSDEVTLTFSAKLPSASQGVKTYALSDADENFIKDIDVLVFTDDGSGNMKFRYRSVGKDITPGVGSTVDIKVTLWRTVVDTRLVIIANARDVINSFDFETGITTPDDIQQGLVYEIDPPGHWLADDDDFTPLPMWGEYDIADGIYGGTEIPPGSIYLLRSVARVDVVVGEGAENFELTGVWVFNSNSNGLIIPEPGKVVGGVAELPSLPIGGSTNNINPLEYQTAGENSVREIYLFEADAQPINDADATALVIGGKYATATDPTYYRIDFRDPNDPAGTAYPVLRNRRYLITIIDALNAGHLDPPTAFAAPSVDPLAAYGGSTGLSPAQARQITASPSPSMQYDDIVPKSKKGITYTITSIQ